MLYKSVLALVNVVGIRAHGWVTAPISKNEMAWHHFVAGMPDDFRYEPQTSNHGNGIGQKLETGGAACGADQVEYTQGLSTWQALYDKASVTVPEIKPGEVIHMNVTLTIDHGGQAWFEIACADKISDDTNWTALQRTADDREHHFMPSAPGAFAWAPMEYGNCQTGCKTSFTSKYQVPADFACPNLKPTKVAAKTEPRRALAASEGATCCWSSWGDVCGPYPSGASGGLCSTDWSKKCTANSDCPAEPVPGPPPPPGPDPTPGTGIVGRWVWKTSNSCNDINNVGRPTETFSQADYLKVVKDFTPGTSWVNQACTTSPETFISCFDFNLIAPPPSPSPSPSPSPTPGPAPGPSPYTPKEKVDGCHEAAKAFCNAGHSNCRGCQAWGEWGNMFFAAVCNDDDSICHHDIMLDDGVTACNCQQSGGCKIDGATCPYSPPTFVYSPRLQKPLNGTA